jgi:dihydrofolate reductase
MRKIIESTLLSLDGVIGAPHVWASERFDEEARAAALEQLQTSDAMLMGRRTYEIFADLWPHQTGSYADTINEIPKYVFSSTLTTTSWTNCAIVHGDVAAEVRRMKEHAGNQLILYGHGPLGAALLEHDLLDELQFAIHPVFVGDGAPLLREGAKATFRLTGVKTLGTGVVVVTYEPARVSASSP